MAAGAGWCFSLVCFGVGKAVTKLDGRERGWGFKFFGDSTAGFFKLGVGMKGG